MLRHLGVFGLAVALSAPAAAGQGTLGLAPDLAWAHPMRDGEMADLRGGIGGLAFSVFFSGGFDHLGNAQGQLNVGTNGLEVPAPEFNVSDGQVNIRTEIGNFQGASGIFQIAQVPGNYNIVNNNLFIQIAVFDGANLADVFGGGLLP